MSEDTEARPPESVDPHAFFKRISHEELKTMSNRQRGFILSIRSLDPTYTGSALKDTVAELFPSAHLFSEELREIPGIWLELRKFLDKNGTAMTQHSSRRVILTLAHSLYDDAEDRHTSI